MADARKAIRVVCDDDLLFELEEWRRRQPVIPSVTEAARRLLTRALQSDRAPQGADQRAVA
jgi:hypothetical protein